MSNNKGLKNTIIAVLILGALGTGAYFLVKSLTNKVRGVSKSDKVVAILSQSGGEGDYNFLMGLHNDFIDAWYAAVIEKKPTFTTANKNFSTITGRQV